MGGNLTFFSTLGARTMRGLSKAMKSESLCPLRQRTKRRALFGSCFLLRRLVSFDLAVPARVRADFAIVFVSRPNLDSYIFFLRRRSHVWNIATGRWALGAAGCWVLRVEAQQAIIERLQRDLSKEKLCTGLTRVLHAESTHTGREDIREGQPQAGPYEVTHLRRFVYKLLK
jgi:hypothetical protein